MSATHQPGDDVGRYRLMEAIGRGGAGLVWRATGPEGEVALKLLRIHDIDLIERLVREAELQRRVESPHVVRVLDIFEHRRAPVLALELVMGPTLLGLLRQRRLTLPVVDRLASELTTGLDAAHRAGVIHRDLKPGNVLMTGTDDAATAKIADFGLARALVDEGDELTRTGMMLGTPGYMAPEQIDDPRAATAATDVFSLGVMLYRMVTGTLPFYSASRFEVLRRTRDGDHVPVGELRPDLPARMTSAIEAALLVDPDRRPEDAARMAAVWRGDEEISTLQARAMAPPRPAPAAASPMLPRPAHPLIGRSDELAAARQGLEAGRVVTLLGMGGVGKTHLALELGREANERGEAAWVCELAEARDAEGLRAAVGRAMGLGGDGDIGAALAGRGRCLLILDHLEHVVGPSTEALVGWTSAAPDARIVLTSRVYVGAPGAASVEVGPLPPQEAFDLFVARAKEARPGFRSDDIDAIQSLVSRLDGLPLALELAAARTRMLPARRLLERLGETLAPLRASGRGRASLDDTIGWSWSLLPDWGQAALAELSVFAGGFSLEAAEAVLDLDGFPDAPWPMDAIGVLVDHSLLRLTEPMPGHERYIVPATVRAYAADRLSPAAARAARARHVSWYAGYGDAEAMRSLTGHGGAPRTRALALDRDNLRAGVEAALEADDSEGAAGCALALAWLFRVGGPWGEGAELLGRVAALRALESPARARLLRNQGRLLSLSGRAEMADYVLEEARALFDRLGNRRGVAIAWMNLAYASRGQGRATEARDRLRQALSALEGIDDPATEAAIQGNLATLLKGEGDLDGARSAYESALEGSRRVGDRRAEGIHLTNLGALHLDAGRRGPARSAFDRGLAAAREAGDRSTESLLLGNRALLDAEDGLTDQARDGFESSIAAARDVGARGYEALARGNLGDLLLDGHEGTEAQAQLRQAIALSEQSMPGAAAAFRGSLALARAQEGDLNGARDLLAAAESVLCEGDPVEYGKLLVRRARVALLAGDRAAAERALSEARGLQLEALEGRLAAVTALLG